MITQQESLIKTTSTEQLQDKNDQCIKVAQRAISYFPRKIQNILIMAWTFRKMSFGLLKQKWICLGVGPTKIAFLK